MRKDPPVYDAAYSHTEGTLGADIVRLVLWFDLGHVSELSIIASGKPALDDNETAQRLIKAGAQGTSYRSMGAVKIRGRSVLALWLDDEQLSRVESSLPGALAVAPWLLDDIAIWRLARKPTEVSSADFPDDLPLDPVVLAAMNELSMMSNPSDGLVSYGKDHAIDSFRLLRDAGYTWDPSACAAIMARGGWRLSSAVDLKVLATEMLAGKSKRTSGHHGKLGPAALAHWRAQAAQF